MIFLGVANSPRPDSDWVVELNFFTLLLDKIAIAASFFSQLREV